ncbi:hypothetical protein JCM33374_g5553 [Metschnikowia sp. JCM 33374]|nr:hypothetical protein JCM33374_g5553 [Metschnikowia sp. JCM 33374]
MKTQAEVAASLKNSAPVNAKDPVRLAFLGGPRTGKTAVISKLSCGTYRDTYYPSRKTTPVLFTFGPSGPESTLILDEHKSQEFLTRASTRDDLLLSPVIYDALARACATHKPAISGAANDGANAMAYSSRNDIYATHADGETPETDITPILAELIDTPAFNSNQFIPFLEASIHARLGKDVLRRLADTPRQPVNTEPLLVASGAGEMNGAIDGYFLLYSAIPSAEPPKYDEVPPSSVRAASSSEESLDSYNSDGTLKTASFGSSKTDTTFSLLPIIKSGLEEAWREYYTYKTRWDQGKEKDIFSIKSAFRTMFDGKSASKTDATQKNLLNTSINPSDPSCPPPIWIICTHKNSPLASPKLINDGKKLAQLWRCGYLAVDITEDIEQMMALVVREVVERRNLQKSRKRR